MKKTITISALFAYFLCFSQIKFEQGYIVEENDEKKNVWIKNLDWMNNPNEFEYKESESSPVIKGNIDKIKQFNVGNNHFVRATVNIDKSSEDLTFLSTEKNPNFNEETLFLKYIIKGEANLYLYKGKNITRYFYSIDQMVPKQLIYKIYSYDNSAIAYNNEYRNQIRQNINCKLTESDIKKMKYQMSDLKKAVIKYNECLGSTIVNYTTLKSDTDKKKNLNFNIKPGMRFSSSSINIPNPYVQPNEVDLDSKASFSIGIELEYIFPFNKNKWAVFTEPTYQSYKSSKNFVINESKISEENVLRSLDYKSVEIPIGIRHYFFLNNKNKLFINIGYIIDIENKNSTMYSEYHPSKLVTGNNMLFGGGFKYNDKFIVELRYLSNRELLNNYPDREAKYNSFGLLLGYTLF